MNPSRRNDNSFQFSNETPMRRGFSTEVSMEGFPLGMAYVPMQRFSGIHDNLEEAFRAGTVFPELNKPFTGRRCVR